MPEPLNQNPQKSKIPNERRFLQTLLGEAQAAERMLKKDNVSCPNLVSVIRMTACRLRDLE